MRYSARLGEISDAQLQRALDCFGLGRLQGARPAPGGLFGQNVMLESTAGAFVLRTHPHADWQLPKERFFSRLVHEHDHVPVPWPYHFEPSTDIFGWPFAVVPAIPGSSGEQAFGGNHRAAHDPTLAAAAGVALGRLHLTHTSKTGAYDLNSDTLTPNSGSYREHIEAIIGALIEQSHAASDATTQADDDWVAGLLGRARPAMDEPFQPAVVHLDYAPGNILGAGDGSGWHVTGIVDWMTAEAGDPEADLSRFLALSRGRGDAARTFLDAYLSIQPRRDGFEQRFPVYMLLDRLWIWEYGQRNHTWFEPGTSLRDFAEPFLGVLEGVGRS